MRIDTSTYIIGLTASFGSGCSTFQGILKKEFDYRTYSLSKLVKDKWSQKNQSRKIDEATRKELQDIGNLMREKKGLEYLAKEIINIADRETKSYEKNKPIVFDSFRNIAEVEYFRKVFPYFYLISINCTPIERWKRCKDKYKSLGLKHRDFIEDDKRDKNEDIPEGQQIELCTDESDISINNETSYSDASLREYVLKNNLRNLLGLLTGDETRTPLPKEVYMNVAYAASLMSNCYKRQVGAAIVNPDGVILSIGYNENPTPIRPCLEQFEYCYKDIYKKDFFNDLINSACPNPECKKILDHIPSNYRCPYCNFDLDGYYIRDRAASRCSALCAEEKAIINAGLSSLDKCIIYTTTFPCFSCAQKIIYTGIKTIYYAESYPDRDSAKLLDIAKKIYEDRNEEGIKVYAFQGVKKKGYFKLFGDWRRETEKKILKRG